MYDCLLTCQHTAGTNDFSVLTITGKQQLLPWTGIMIQAVDVSAVMSDCSCQVMFSFHIQHWSDSLPQSAGRATRTSTSVNQLGGSDRGHDGTELWGLLTIWISVHYLLVMRANLAQKHTDNISEIDSWLFPNCSH